MLDPHSRRHLFEALRPPPGYQLDFAIGTTYSLDLIALLSAPLSFTFLDWEADDERGRRTPDPLALLESLRRYADRIAIFCEAGQIAIPKKSQPLFSHLEDMVHEVSAPRGGAFHPKVWLLRFVGDDGIPNYRLLCLSRNLTFDRSWDTVLVLDGALDRIAPPNQTNIPVVAFFDALPAMVVRHSVSVELQRRLALVRDELYQVQFECPGEFQQMVFHPLGIPGAPLWPFPNHVNRLFVMSPFITSGCLERLAHMAPDVQLVARLEELQKLNPDALTPFQHIFTLSPAADPEDAIDQEGEPQHETLNGLHAKVYVADAGEQAHIWTGSANASDAAFSINVEFVVELVGPIRVCGVQAVLGEDREVGLRKLLEPFMPLQDGPPADALLKMLEDLADEARRKISRLDLHAHVVPSTEPEHYAIELRLMNGEEVVLPHGVSATCWPITLNQNTAGIPLVGTSPLARFPDLSLESLTSFFAFTVTARHDGHWYECHFVLNLPLVDAPVNRRERMLRAMLQDRDQVMRFLMLLLSDDSDELSSLVALQESREGNPSASSTANLFGLPLFEAMVRALDRDPEKLDYIQRLVDDLRKTPEGQKLLPETFDSIWAPILAAREELKS